MVELRNERREDGAGEGCEERQEAGYCTLVEFEEMSICVRRIEAGKTRQFLLILFLTNCLWHAQGKRGYEDERRMNHKLTRHAVRMISRQRF